ncbi:MAG: hypothetical protein AAFV80_03165, partial [Bacteroidota bacterium]
QSSDEEMSAGYAGTHSYAVLEVKDQDGKKFVKVRNPWGYYVKQKTTVGDYLDDMCILLANKGYSHVRENQRRDEKFKSPSNLAEHLRTIKEQLELEEFFEFHLEFKRRQLMEIKSIILEMVPYLKATNLAEPILVGAQFSRDEGTESGEFWAPLEDLTKVYRQINIA